MLVQHVCRAMFVCTPPTGLSLMLPSVRITHTRTHAHKFTNCTMFGPIAYRKHVCQAYSARLLRDFVCTPPLPKAIYMVPRCGLIDASPPHARTHTHSYIHSPTLTQTYTRTHTHTQDAQQRVLAKEAEARHLRDHLAANLPPAKASAVSPFVAIGSWSLIIGSW
jgi:hypothetical protein